MKVLITGATGLVGQELVAVLHKKGYSVNYLTTSKHKIESQQNYQGFFWNPSKKEIDLKCFDGIDAIINLAGASIAKRWTKAHKKRVINSRLESIQTLKYGLSKVDRRKIKTAVSASAIGVYPNSLTTFYDESYKGKDDSFLGEVVELWENEFDKLNIFDIELAKIRIGLVLSTNGGALPQMANPVKWFVGSPLGSGDQWQSWIHINDLANLFVHVLENNLDGIYNAVAPNPVTNKKLTKELATVLNRPLWLPAVPKMLLKLVLGKMSYILLASQRVSSKKIENSGFEFRFLNICAALENLYNVENTQNLIQKVGKEEYA